MQNSAKALFFVLYFDFYGILILWIKKILKTMQIMNTDDGWKKSVKDVRLQQELEQLADNEEERIDSFYTDLQFGTSGLRGIIGAGTNRMNEYVVRRTTQGLADYLNGHCSEPSIVIAYDSRKKSKVFALETAKTLRGNGIEVFLFQEIAPVSLLSYAIGRLHCSMGIMITASHNPKIFNGYKVYNQNGYQIVGEEADQISEAIDQLDFFEGIRVSEEGIRFVDEWVCDDFIAKITSFSLCLAKRRHSAPYLSSIVR